MRSVMSTAQSKNNQTLIFTAIPEHVLRNTLSILSILLLLAVWRSGNGVVRISEVTLRRARLVLGWVTVFGRAYHLGM